MDGTEGQVADEKSTFNTRSEEGRRNRSYKGYLGMLMCVQLYICAVACISDECQYSDKKLICMPNDQVDV